jgi:acetyl-CoA carboxylase biotin carboxylase subunit
MIRMRRALSMFVVDGIHTTIPLHEQILEDERFISGEFDTSFLNYLHEERLAATGD